MALPVAAWILTGITVFGLLVVAIEVGFLRAVRRRRIPEPRQFPRVSIIKPLCGLDDELLQNLESHLNLDYPAEYEILLGVRSAQDPAYVLARDFAAAHPDRVRLVIQQGEPGHNPKVNQLITLTRAAQHAVIVITDSNVRVHPSYLRELASVLERPGVGLASNLFVGVGEEKFGAVLDNLTLASFCAPNVAAAEMLLPGDQIVGKSLAIPRAVLEQLGGWHLVKDVLAEDQQLGIALKSLGLRSELCPTPIRNVQKTQSLAAFWGRHTRWAMIRFRVLVPGCFLEPLLNPLVFAIAAVAVAPRHPLTWSVLGVTALGMMVLTQLAALWGRGYGFRLHHLLLVPLRDVLFFLAWLRGATLRWVNWRGNRLLVLSKTRLAEPETFARARNIHRNSRSSER